MSPQGHNNFLVHSMWQTEITSARDNFMIYINQSSQEHDILQKTKTAYFICQSNFSNLDVCHSVTVNNSRLSVDPLLYIKLDHTVVLIMKYDCRFDK